MNNHYINISDDFYTVNCADCDISCLRCTSESILDCVICNNGYIRSKETNECEKKVNPKPPKKKIPPWGIVLIVLGVILIIIAILGGIYMI